MSTEVVADDRALRTGRRERALAQMDKHNLDVLEPLVTRRLEVMQRPVAARSHERGRVPVGVLTRLDARAVGPFGARE